MGYRLAQSHERSRRGHTWQLCHLDKGSDKHEVRNDLVTLCKVRIARRPIPEYLESARNPAILPTTAFEQSRSVETTLVTDRSSDIVPCIFVARRDDTGKRKISAEKIFRYPRKTYRRSPAFCTTAIAFWFPPKAPYSSTNRSPRKYGCQSWNAKECLVALTSQQY